MIAASACIRCGGMRGMKHTSRVNERDSGMCNTCRDGLKQGHNPTWRHQLDRDIRRQPTRTPLRRDPILWEAFAPDRAEIAKRASGRPQITDCAGTCGRRLRRSHRKACTAPGTVPMYSGGMCEACWRASQETAA